MVCAAFTTQSLLSRSIHAGRIPVSLMTLSSASATVMPYMSSRSRSSLGTSYSWSSMCQAWPR